MKNVLFGFFAVMYLASCSSTDNKKLEEREHEDIKRDYVVTDSSSDTRPGWIEDPEVWARQHSLDVTKDRYFSHETTPKVDRAVACDLANAKAKATIAGEITTFIDKSLGESSEGTASVDSNNPLPVSLREFVENTLVEKVQALIHGAAVAKTYWEKRTYKKDLGAKRDFTAYTCAVFVRMPSERLKDAIDEAANHVVRAADDPETKENVKKALENASENFVKAKTGQL